VNRWLTTYDGLTLEPEELRGTLYRFGIVLTLLLFFTWQI
jgi:hypothetical protein